MMIHHGGMTIEHRVSERVTQTIAIVSGRTFEVTRFHGGRIELYEQDPADGIFMFLGYLDAIATFIPPTVWRELAPVVEDHERAHARFWSAYLPGADRWIN